MSSIKERWNGSKAFRRKGALQSAQRHALGALAEQKCRGGSAPLTIKCHGCWVIGGTEPDAPPSGQGLASLTFIISTQLLTADADVLAGSSGHRVPTRRMASP